MNYETLEIREENIAQHAVSLILINRQMRIKINRKVAFLLWYSRTKKSK